MNADAPGTTEKKEGMMDLQPLMPWLAAIALILSLGNTVFGLLTSGSKDNSKRIGELDSKLAGHDRRIQTVENELKHLPDKDSVTELKLAIADLRGTVNTMGEAVGSVQRTVHRIDDYLRQENK